MYALMTPDQRAYYLRWIEQGRVGPLPETGYAFLYFCGLERRVFLDRQDLIPIVKEALGLLTRYGSDSSFDQCLRRFLIFALARVGIERVKEKWFHRICDESRLPPDQDSLAIALAWFRLRELPLPTAWAFRMARQQPGSPTSVVMNRLPDQLRRCSRNDTTNGLVAA